MAIGNDEGGASVSAVLWLGGPLLVLVLVLCVGKKQKNKRESADGSTPNGRDLPSIEDITHPSTSPLVVQTSTFDHPYGQLGAGGGGSGIGGGIGGGIPSFPLPTGSSTDGTPNRRYSEIPSGVQVKMLDTNGGAFMSFEGGGGFDEFGTDFSSFPAPPGGGGGGGGGSGVADINNFIIPIQPTTNSNTNNSNNQAGGFAPALPPEFQYLLGFGTDQSTTLNMPGESEVGMPVVLGYEYVNVSHNAASSDFDFNNTDSQPSFPESAYEVIRDTKTSNNNNTTNNNTNNIASAYLAAISSPTSAAATAGSPPPRPTSSAPNRTTTPTTTTTTTTPTSAKAPIVGNDVYEDIRHDAVAQQAARMSMSFASTFKSDVNKSATLAHSPSKAAASALAASLDLTAKNKTATISSLSDLSPPLLTSAAKSSGYKQYVPPSSPNGLITDTTYTAMGAQNSSNDTYTAMSPIGGGGRSDPPYVNTAGAPPIPPSITTTGQPRYEDVTFPYEDVTLRTTQSTTSKPSGIFPKGYIPPAPLSSSPNRSNTKSASYVNTSIDGKPLADNNYVNTNTPPSQLSSPSNNAAASLEPSYGNITMNRQGSGGAGASAGAGAGGVSGFGRKESTSSFLGLPSDNPAEEALYENNDLSRRQFMTAHANGLAHPHTPLHHSSANYANSPQQHTITLPVLESSYDSVDVIHRDDKKNGVQEEEEEGEVELPTFEEWLVSPLDLEKYKALSQNKQAASGVPANVRNKVYNRHLDVLPNPATRVPLDEYPGDDTSTYINANFISNCAGSARAYVCTQAPLPDTIGHFWRMIWQHRIADICMATGLVEKGEEKCTQYWPEHTGALNRMTVLDWVITSTSISNHTGYQLTELDLTHKGETRKVFHWWYQAWPDHGVPRKDGKPDPSSCVDMLYAIRKRKRTSRAPTVFHCSAGVGRSGTLIAMDICMSLLETRGKVDPTHVVKKIREDRVALVQHPQQFGLVNAACFYYAGEMGVPCSEDRAVIVVE